MGIPVDTELYTEADAAGHCQLLLFDGRTPQYIEAHISGVTLCPLSTAALPNGTVVLTQVAAIRWELTNANHFFQIIFHADYTQFSIFGFPAAQILFIGTEDPCVDFIENDQLDCDPPNMGKDGEVTLFWGPGISL